MERIKIIGELDLKREQDRRIYETSGLAPTLRAENHDVKILVGITINMGGYSYEKTRQDKTRQDKTRQDKTMIPGRFVLVKWLYWGQWITPLTTLLRVQTGYIRVLGFVRQSRLAPVAEYNQKSKWK